MGLPTAYATWKAPLQKVVPSKWLAETARSLGEDAVVIPYGLDIENFQMVTPYEERRPNQLMMLYHNAEWKGCEEGIQALSLVRERDPEVRATLFGVPARPKTLPDWIDTIISRRHRSCCASCTTRLPFSSLPAGPRDGV